MKDTTKKWVFVAGGLVISAVLVALIAAKFTPADIPAISPPSSVSEMPQEEKKPVVIVPDIQKSKPTANGDANGSEQTIQPDASKPESPAHPPKLEDADAIKDPSTPPEYDANDTEVKPTSKPDDPKGGDTKDGKIYVPGFGWVENSGPNQGGIAEDMYENGNKIGIM